MSLHSPSPSILSTSLAPDSKLHLPASCDPPSPANPPAQRVWVVFGATGHLGRSIVKAALAHDDIVVAVGWSQHDTIDDLHASLSSLAASLKPTSPPAPTFTTTSPPQPPPPSPPSPSHAPVPPNHTDPSLPPTAQPTSTHAGETNSATFLALTCDIRIPSTVNAVFTTALSWAGRYDIVVSCAGYGLIGPCEEQGEFEIRGQVETNFFGVLNILQLSLPYFRSRSQHSSTGLHGRSEEGQGEGEDGGGTDSEDEDDGGDERGGGNGEGRAGDGDGGDGGGRGRYLIFSSTSGALGVPGLGPYCATKFAVEGLVESLLYETAGCDIRATLVEPGHVRRDDEGIPAPSPVKDQKGQAVANGVGGGGGGGGGGLAAAGEKGAAKDKSREYGHFRVLDPPKGSVYASPTAPAKHAERVMQWLGERQPTSAAKAAELMWQLGHCRFPPLRLLLGAYAVESVRERMRGITEEIEDWKNLSFPLAGDEGDSAMATPVKKRRRESRNRDYGEELSEDEDMDEDVKMEDEGEGVGYSR